MKEENIIEIHDLKDFVEAIRKINSEFKTTWFRGHENSAYTLTPSIYRDPFNCDLESDFLLHFQSKSIELRSLF